MSNITVEPECNIGSAKRHCPSQVEKILALFVESGIIFCLIQVWFSRF